MAIKTCFEMDMIYSVISTRTKCLEEEFASTLYAYIINLFEIICWLLSCGLHNSAILSLLIYLKNVAEGCCSAKFRPFCKASNIVSRTVLVHCLTRYLLYAPYLGFHRLPECVRRHSTIGCFPVIYL